MRQYWVVDYAFGEDYGSFVTREEAIGYAIRCHEQSKGGTTYIVEYREEIFSTAEWHSVKVA